MELGAGIKWLLRFLLQSPRWILRQIQTAGHHPHSCQVFNPYHPAGRPSDATHNIA